MLLDHNASQVLTPTKHQDYRMPSGIEAATQDELVVFARKNGLDVPWNIPRDVLVKQLQDRGLTNIRAAVRVMGRPVGVESETEADPKVKTASLEDVRAAEWQAQQGKPTTLAIPELSVNEFGMKELRALAKSRGIKVARTDTIETLRAKLNG